MQWLNVIINFFFFSFFNSETVILSFAVKSAKQHDRGS